MSLNSLNLNRSHLDQHSRQLLLSALLKIKCTRMQLWRAMRLTELDSTSAHNIGEKELMFTFRAPRLLLLY